MQSWSILLATSETDDAELKTIEVVASSKTEALEIATSQCLGTDFKISDIIKKVVGHGGARPGAGQPSKYGEKTKTVRLPESLADQRDLIVAIPELQKLLDELEQDCLDNPDSARRYFLRKAISQIRCLGF